MKESYHPHNNGNGGFRHLTHKQQQISTAQAKEKSYMGAQLTFSIKTYVYDRWRMDRIRQIWADGYGLYYGDGTGSMLESYRDTGQWTTPQIAPTQFTLNMSTTLIKWRRPHDTETHATPTLKIVTIA